MESIIIQMRDQTKIYAEIRKIKNSTNNTPWLIATHGVGEHLGRHQYLSEVFGEKFNLFQYDVRGHGKSSGKKGDVNSFTEYLEDLREILDYLKENHNVEKFSLFGHSMGALITCAFTQRYLKEDFYPDLVIVNAPPVGLDGILGKIVDLIPKELLEGASKLPFSVPLPNLVDLKKLSHDPIVEEAYKADPLANTKLYSKLALELVRESKETFSRPIRCRAKAFVSIGRGDVVVGVEPLLEYFKTIEKGFGVKVFEEAYHEIHNEVSPMRDEYFDYLKSIIN